MRILYQCDYCEFTASSEYECQKHENTCIMHPKFKRCESCYFLLKKDDKKSICRNPRKWHNFIPMKINCDEWVPII